LQNIEAITIDLDDTLWDIDPVIERAERILWRWLASNYPRISSIYDQNKILNLRLEIVKDHPDKEFDYRFMRKLILRKIFRDADYEEDLAEGAFAIFDSERNNVTLYDGAIYTLQSLSKKYTLIAVTNGNANLEKIGLRHLFDDVVTAVDVGYAKPDARIFNEAIRKAGTQADKIIHVGDNPEADIIGAANVGLKTVWMNSKSVSWPNDDIQPDLTINRITELCDLLLPEIN
jgi:putative hydrolase of the HAD superfamily|tara:strand:+ start:24752 stop:25447 length:696 start_codon:yes stop_codon:yes gene_type:complete